MAEEAPNDNKYLHPRSASEHNVLSETDDNHGVSINLPESHDTRPPPVKHMSAPAYQSPIRHHRRAPSRSKGVKETLDARSSYGSSDDASVHRINQYIIKQEIGRGSFGAVHLAVDQYGSEYAVKEFSKSRLRKRAQSNLLRKPNQGRKPGQIAAGLGFNSPMHRLSSSEMMPAEANNSLSLIKEEIAIMKKLNHNNLVSLIEVLDDPQEDSLYMVLEMCKKGVAMRVGLDERADPYDDETCRCWFRDMILGIEYLHAQGIIHRDIKPDNCLITQDDVLKIVDFGVSEMFEKASEMATAKSAGSPAFMPPELCVAKHGQVSGRAADIWSMGVTLYCLRYGRIPFEKGSIIELYDSIRGEDLSLDAESDANFADLMKRILDKDPESRITMEGIRNHPWVTKNGTDTLLSAEENCADLVEPPTEAEMDHAITGNMAHILAVMGAVKRFKGLVRDQRGRLMEGIFGKDSRLVAPPNSIRTQTRSAETHDRRPMDKILVREGINRDVDVDSDVQKMSHDIDKMILNQDPEIHLYTSPISATDETDAHFKQRLETESHRPLTAQSPSDHQGDANRRSWTLPIMDPAPGKGQAHNPLEDQLYLGIGWDPDLAPQDDDGWLVSESPPAVDMNIYEIAYQEEMERILARRGREPSVYMTRRVEHRDDIRRLQAIKDAGKYAARRTAEKGYGLYTKYYADADSRDARREARRRAAERIAGRFVGVSPTEVPEKAPEQATEKAPKKSEANDTLPEWEKSESREGREGWRATAKSYASDYYDSWRPTARSAHERISDLYTRSGAREGFSDFVTRAQAKARGETPADPDPQPSSATSTAPELKTSPTDMAAEVLKAAASTGATSQAAESQDNQEQNEPRSSSLPAVIQPPSAIKRKPVPTSNTST